MTARIWLIVTLTFWLLITIVRQVFDLVGKLWIPVGFNLLQILCCITGLFGVCQKRVFLLIALTISTVISISQNILIFLWYIGVFGDTSRPVLSAGLPYSYSFFLRHTPFCGARFDLQRSRWVQSSCAVPYTQIEAGQALLHVILAAITMILSIIVILERKREKNRPKLPLPVQYAQIKRNQMPPPHTISEPGSGYVGSSYEDIVAAPVAEHRAPPIGYERHNRNKRAKIRPNSMPQPVFDQYSCMNSSDNDDLCLRSQTKRSSSTASGRFRKSTEPPRRASMHEQLDAHDEPNEQEFGRPSGTLTSLVSFDPKSRTLLRVREHRDSDDDDVEGYTHIEKQLNVDNGLHERIRPKGLRDRLSPPSATLNLSGERSSNPSNESLPNVMAPVLRVADTPSTGNHDVSSSDSGFPPSQYWRSSGTSPREDQLRQQHLQKSGGAESPGIRLTQDENRPDDRRGPSSDYRSNFRIEPVDRGLAVGHYHSINEFRLTNRSPTQAMPVITGAGLLV